MTVINGTSDIGDWEKQKFVETADGNVAVRVRLVA
jgi:hypothetical protein